MQDLRIGHFSDADRGTGLSVFLFDHPAKGAALICGSGPASHELAPLEPDMSVSEVHGLMLSGGSAYGLCAVGGVMRFLTEKKLGLPVPHGVIPIVPAAAVYDLAYKAASPPTEADAYAACQKAQLNNCDSGQIGAGTGATVGKLIPHACHMTGGIGRAKIDLPNGVEILAYVVVNAVGDVRDGENIIAGACDETGRFLNSEKYVMEHLVSRQNPSNTTLAAIFINADLSKGELKRICKMAAAGMARCIFPVFTCFDGDLIFAFSLGKKTASIISIGVAAADAVHNAILDAVKNSQILNIRK